MAIMLDCYPLKDMKNIKNIVLVGNLSVLPQAPQIFSDLEKMFGVKIYIPENSAYGTVIGAALEGLGR